VDRSERMLLLILSIRLCVVPVGRLNGLANSAGSLTIPLIILIGYLFMIANVQFVVKKRKRRNVEVNMIG
jgi:hypothetical protein